MAPYRAGALRELLLGATAPSTVLEWGAEAETDNDQEGRLRDSGPRSEQREVGAVCESGLLAAAWHWGGGVCIHGASI